MWLLLLAIGAFFLAVTLMVRAIPEEAWDRIGLGVLGATLAVGLLLSIIAFHPAQVAAKQAPVSGCAYAESPICAPFLETWSATEWFYGPATGPAIQWNGFLTQCYSRGCLQHFPNNPAGYTVQGMLLGEQFLAEEGLTPDPANRIVVPPVVTRWMADKAQTANLLPLMGQPLKGIVHSNKLGKDVVIYQMAVLSWGTEDDVAQVKLEPLGELISPLNPPAPVPIWATPLFRLLLLVGSLATSGLSLLRGLLDSGGPI